jgi:L,D-transpeptidase catalytic domain
MRQLIAPKKTPHDFEFNFGDRHLIVNDDLETIKAFDYQGVKLWERPCLARGQWEDNNWRDPNSDTPPGLYKIGEVYRDYENADEIPTHIKQSFGWYTFDLEELENQEQSVGRAGICLHGGGSNCGWPGAWVEYQKLFPTCGCIRMYNRDLLDLVLPLVEKGTVYISVYQEA